MALCTRKRACAQLAVEGTTVRARSGGYRVRMHRCMHARRVAPHRASTRFGACVQVTAPSGRATERRTALAPVTRRATRRSPARRAGLLPVQPRADSNCRYRLERAASSATRRRGQISCQSRRGGRCCELGGEDSNPQRQDQNLLCCRLHHPRRSVHDSGRVSSGSQAIPRRAEPGDRALPPEEEHRVEQR